MGNDFLFSFLPMGKETLSSLLIQPYGAIFFLFEIFRRDDAIIHQGQYETIRIDAPEFFHQVQGKGLPARPVSMEEAGIGIQSRRFQGRGAVMGQYGIGK